MRNILLFIMFLLPLAALAVEPVAVRHGSIPGDAQIITNTAALYADATNLAASANAQAASAIAAEASRAIAAENAKQNTLTYDTDVNLRSIHTQYAQLDNQGNLTDLSSIHLSYGNSWESILSSAGVTLQSVLDGKASVDALSSESAARVAGDLAATNHVIAATNALAATIPGSPTGLVASATIAYSINALSIPVAAGATLSATVSGWPEGQAVMAFIAPAGSYTPSGLSLVGYAGWPTNSFQCAAWRYGTNVFVNIISTL